MAHRRTVVNFMHSKRAANISAYIRITIDDNTRDRLQKPKLSV